MTPEDFRRIALSFDGAEEIRYPTRMVFQANGNAFAILATSGNRLATVALTAKQQGTLSRANPKVFIPLAGRQGRRRATEVVLARATETVLHTALAAAWNNISKIRDTGRIVRRWNDRIKQARL